MVTHDPTYLRTWAPFVHGFFIEGISTWWTDDASGLMLGSTVSGLTDRTCKKGLVVPDLEEGLDFQTAWLQTTQPTFRLIDFDEGLAQLFGQEPADSDRNLLISTIEPTTDPLTTIQVTGDLSFDPTNKYIGIERIGPSKERRHFPCFNFTLPPLRHPVNRSARPGDNSQIWVTSTPLIWEGRLVALYRFFIEERNSDVTRFGTFANAELVWAGVLRDKASIGPNRQWNLPCYGPDGMLKRPLNATIQTFREEGDDESRGDHPWWPVSTTLSLTAAESKVGVFFSGYNASALEFDKRYKSSAFHGDNDLIPSTPLGLADSLNAIVQGVADGTNSGINIATGQGAFEDDDFSSAATGKNRAIVRLGKIGIGTGRYDAGATTRAAYLHLVLHEKAWLSMGWDVRAQGTGGATPVEAKRVNFLPAGGTNPVSHFEVFDGQIDIPEGYWTAEISTLTSPGRYVDNGGHMRMYEALWPQGVAMLDMEAGQTVLLPWDKPFWEGDNLGFPPADGITINGNTLDRTRLFAVRGKYLPPLEAGPLGTPLPDQATEPEDVVQVCRASWYDNDGHVGGDSDGRPALYIEEWLDPRTFGFNFPSIAREALYWSSPAPGHEFVPLGAMVTARRRDEVETRYEQFVRLLVSTGTAAWSGNGPTATISAGNHDTSTSGIGGWANDTAAASMGLGIPTDLVATADEIRAAYEEADPDGSWQGALQQVRLAFVGAVNSEEVIDALTVPVGLGWRLHGGTFGLFPLFATPTQDDVDLVIGESDLARIEGPDHGRKLDGVFSRLELRYRLDPMTGSTAVERRDAALDDSARFRPGNLPRELVDLGALPVQWWGGEKTPFDHWGNAFRELWLRQVPHFFAQRNFTVSDLHIRREKGIDVRVGTLLRLTNPWPQNPDQGNYGLTNVIARVMNVRRTPEGTAICEVLVYASSLGTSLGTYYAPCARLCGYDSANRLLKYIPNWRGTDETIDDTKGFVKPTWAAGSGNMHVTLYRWNRREWSTGPTGFVESVDTVNNTITIAAPGLTGTYYRDSDYLMIPSDYDNVNQADWVKSIYGVITLDDGTFGSGPTQGKRYV